MAMDEHELNFSDSLHAIIVAAGQGTRMGGPLPKQFLSLRGRPILDWSVAAFNSMEEVKGIILVVPEDHYEYTSKRAKQQKDFSKVTDVVIGGNSRQESVYSGIQALPPDVQWVAVHDAVRPFVTPQLIQATLTLAQQVGVAIPTVAIHDTLIQVDGDDMLVRPISRDAIRRSQTPQIFWADILGDAHQKALDQGLEFTDDATLVSYFSHPVGTFSHFGENRKITTPQDLEKITMQKLRKLSSVRIGQGFDAHPFVDGRPLILGGVKFNHPQGLDGHSDADVLSHAICDAIFGGAAMGDIGQHFPNTDPAYRNASSLALLEETAQMIREKGYEITYIDATVIGEEPKISLRREEIVDNIAHALSIDSDLISIKATTTEGMGFTGRKEGLSAMAVATMTTSHEE